MLEFRPLRRIRTGPARRRTIGATALGAALLSAASAHAASVYIALGDSITFGETDLSYQGSLGDRGYVGFYADTLASRSGGVRPEVVNLAIDGETAASFMSGSGRTPPVAGRGDLPLALENQHYGSPSPVSQSQLFLSTVAAEKAAGNTVSTVTITLGFNELGALAALPTAQALAAIPGTLSAYQTSYAGVLSEIRQQLPTANLLLLGYFNPFPANPTSPGAPIFNTAGTQLNAIIKGLAGTYGASFVDTATAFVGHEAAYTYLDELPAGSSVAGPFGGLLPIGDVHPNAAGYAAIAAQVAAVPEPSTWAMLAIGLVVAAGATRRRRG